MTNSHARTCFFLSTFSSLTLFTTSNSIYGSTKLLSLSSHVYFFCRNLHFAQLNQIFICDTGSNRLMNYYYYHFFSHILSINARVMVESARKKLNKIQCFSTWVYCKSHLNSYHICIIIICEMMLSISGKNERNHTRQTIFIKLISSFACIQHLLVL